MRPSIIGIAAAFPLAVMTQGCGALWICHPRRGAEARGFGLRRSAQAAMSVMDDGVGVRWFAGGRPAGSVVEAVRTLFPFDR